MAISGEGVRMQYCVSMTIVPGLMNNGLNSLALNSSPEQ